MSIPYQKNKAAQAAAAPAVIDPVATETLAPTAIANGKQAEMIIHSETRL